MMHSPRSPKTSLFRLQNIANPMAMSVFVRQEKITVRMGLPSDPIDPTKTRLMLAYCNAAAHWL